jgi:hypothetical protein
MSASLITVYEFYRLQGMEEGTIIEAKMGKWAPPGFNPLGMMAGV